MNWMRRVLALGLIAGLMACGGGGSGSDSDDGSWLSFMPSSLQESLMEGTSAPLLVQAHSSRTISQSLYVKIVDTGGVTTGVFNDYSSHPDYKVQMEISPELSPGVHTGHFEISLYTDPELTQRFESAVWQVPYEITIGARRTTHRLLSDRQAVGFAAFPNATLSRLNAVVNISDNLSRTTPWTATSDQAWLSATPSGTTGNTSELVLVANPASLPANAISYATVTVTSSDTSVVNQETIRVALWKGSVNPSAHTGGAMYSKTIADRAAPLIYAHAGSSIDVLNAYTGATVATLDPGAGATLGDMATSSDGTRLYVADGTTQAIIVFDLVNRTRVTSWPVGDIYRDYMSMQYIRPNGVGVLVTTQGLAFLASTGELIRNDLRIGAAQLVASGDGQALYGVSSGISPPSAYKWAIDFVDYDNIGLEVVLDKELGDFAGHGFYSLLALSPDGSKLYVGAARLDTETFASEAFLPYADLGDNGNAMSAIAVGSDGRIYASYGTEFNVFDANGTLVRRHIAEAFLYGATVTADGVIGAFTEYGFGVEERMRFDRW